LVPKLTASGVLLLKMLRRGYSISKSSWEMALANALTP